MPSKADRWYRHVLKHKVKAGLDIMLHHLFVDFVHRLACRADSCMLMQKARALREDLLINGFPEICLPKLTGKAGHAWSGRWRRRYGINMETTGMQLKVSCEQRTRRVRVLLGNIFRLRAMARLFAHYR